VTDRRVALPRPDELRDDVRALVPLIAPPGREPAETMRLLARLPDLFSPFLGWAAALALHGTVPKRDHEIVALRTAFRCGSEYEFVEHAAYAREAGLSTGEIAAVGEQATVTWAEHEMGLLALADELWTTGNVGDATWRTLSDHYEEPQLVELIFVAGQYTMLSYVANACGPTGPG
jgi:alkylhydroperoxidase family enzyme